MALGLAITAQEMGSTFGQCPRTGAGWLAAAALMVLPFSESPAQSGAAGQNPDVDPFHWGYAPMFGSGVYRLGDGTEARVVRAPLRKTLREAGEARVGVRLFFPVTVGFQNLDDEALAPGRRDDRVEHASFLPGVEVEFLPGERLTLRTRAQLGWGTELEGMEESARLAAVGVRSRIGWSDAPGRPALINGVLWAGFDREHGERRSMLRLTNALEFDIRVPRWEFRDQPMRLLPHILGDWYYRPPEALAFGDDEFAQLEREWQVGLAAGREQGFELLGLEFDSVGIAYRFSEHSDGIRLYVNSVF